MMSDSVQLLIKLHTMTCLVCQAKVRQDAHLHGAQFVTCAVQKCIDTRRQGNIPAGVATSLIAALGEPARSTPWASLEGPLAAAF